MKFKSAGDFKFYLYLSRAKLEMLYRQIARESKTTSSIEWKVDIKALSVAKKSASEEQVDEDDKLKAVLAELEDRQLVGAIEQGKPYIKGIFTMRWGIYNDSHCRPDNEGPLVWFSGITDNVLLALGGSSHHIKGCYGLQSTGSRSCTPTLVRFLRHGMKTGDIDSIRRPYASEFYDEDSELSEAMALANYYLKGPEQDLEFVAKVLWRATTTRIIPWAKDGFGEAILATPLYVSQVHPKMEDE